MTNTGVSPVNDEMQGITKKVRPSNLKGLRWYLGAVNQLNSFIPNLATLCFPFRKYTEKTQIDSGQMNIKKHSLNYMKK